MPTALLLRLALREVGDDSGGPMTFLDALHRRGGPEVFSAAVALVGDTIAVRRELGVRILRELGPEQPGGGRPFSAVTIPLLLDRLRDETDPGVLRWVVSALGHHRVHTALPAVLELAAHPDQRVRFHVAAALPSLVDLADVEPAAAEALIRLCEDEDADIRYYALYAATREISGLDTEAMIRLTERLRDDPDEQVRTMAAEHHTAVHEVRRLLNEWDFIGVFDPDKNIDEYDCLIGGLLVALVEDVDATGIRELLDDEIRHHFGMEPADAGTAAMADRLVTWWRRAP